MAKFGEAKFDQDKFEEESGRALATDRVLDTDRVLATDRVAIRNFPYSGKFDGIDDKVTIPDSVDFDIANKLSVFAWINLKDVPVGTLYTIASKFEWDSGNNREWFFTINANQEINLSISSDGSGDNNFYGGFAGNEIIDINKWFLVGFVYDGATVKIYRNGLEIQSDAFNSDIFNGPADVLIGAMNAGATNRFNGKITKPLIYNKALTASEFLSMYYDNIIPSGAVMNLDFAEGSGDDIADISGNGNDGTIDGAIWSEETPHKPRVAI